MGYKRKSPEIIEFQDFSLDCSFYQRSGSAASVGMLTTKKGETLFLLF
jgi:hypothetical protein